MFVLILLAIVNRPRTCYTPAATLPLSPWSLQQPPPPPPLPPPHLLLGKRLYLLHVQSHGIPAPPITLPSHTPKHALVRLSTTHPSHTSGQNGTSLRGTPSAGQHWDLCQPGAPPAAAAAPSPPGWTDRAKLRQPHAKPASQTGDPPSRRRLCNAWVVPLLSHAYHPAHPDRYQFWTAII